MMIIKVLIGFNFCCKEKIKGLIKKGNTLNNLLIFRIYLEVAEIVRMFRDTARGGLVIPADIDQLLVAVFPHAFNLAASCMNTVFPLFAGEVNEAFGEIVPLEPVFSAAGVGQRSSDNLASSLSHKNFAQLFIESIVIDFGDVEHSLLLLAFLVIPCNEFLHILFTDFLKEKFDTEILMVISTLNRGAQVINNCSNVSHSTDHIICEVYAMWVRREDGGLRRCGARRYRRSAYLGANHSDKRRLRGTPAKTVARSAHPTNRSGCD